MAALDVDDDDTKYHKTTLDNTATASRYQGPRGAQSFWCILLTDSVTVYAQVGPDVLQASTNLSTDNVDQGPTLIYNTWSRIPASAKDASQPGSNRPAVFLQASGAAVVKYRWTGGE